MPRRRTDKRWTELTQRYRQRLHEAGINREDWKGGASLRAIPVPDQERVELATQRLAHGDSTYEDERVLRRWWSGGDVPEELQEFGDLSPAAAAVLAQVGNLDDWTNARFAPKTLASGEAWVLIVEHDDGSTSTVEVPNDVGIVGELRDYMNDYEDDHDDFEWDIEGTK
jgi:hypothetical protein